MTYGYGLNRALSLVPVETKTLSQILFSLLSSEHPNLQRAAMRSLRVLVQYSGIGGGSAMRTKQVASTLLQITANHGQAPLLAQEAAALLSYLCEPLGTEIIFRKLVTEDFTEESATGMLRRKK